MASRLQLFLRRGRGVRSLKKFVGIAGACLVALGVLFPVAPAAGQEYVSVEDAVKIALDNSRDLKSLEEQVDRLWEQRKDVAEDVNYIPAPGAGVVVTQAQALWSNLLNVDINWQIKKRELAETRRKLALDVATAYSNVVSAAENLKKAEIAARRDEEALKNMRVMVAVGAATEGSLAGLEAQAENSRKAREVAEQNLNKAYEALNRLMGVGLDRRYEVALPEYLKLEVKDVDAEAERAVDTNYDVWLIKRKIDIENWDLDYPYTLGSGSTTVVKEYDIEKHDVYALEHSLVSAQDKVREQVKKAYRDILALEEQVAAAEKALAAAEKALRDARVQYEVGVIIREQLLRAEAQVAEALSGLNSLKAAHFASLASFRWLTGREPVEIKF